MYNPTKSGKQADRQTDGRNDMQASGQTGRQTGRNSKRDRHRCVWVYSTQIEFNHNNKDSNFSYFTKKKNNIINQTLKAYVPFAFNLIIIFKTFHEDATAVNS